MTLAAAKVITATLVNVLATATMHSPSLPSCARAAASAASPGFSQQVALQVIVPRDQPMPFRGVGVPHAVSALPQTPAP
ncbi:hypothetical protein [Mycobacterium sp. shizuoka-1]|uniref:hypothetical protein n=1 Tax=Mycobacterium sp. shizuoka-1 TaxID=2039281 RepID=UPI000C0615A7|nr:hypothetical protein [Mycobacterium sp. shizuoka-1]GAY15396.1 hypothetical protein MSZK_21220 [Mycobacterium sp. shizuoka-1]